MLDVVLAPGRDKALRRRHPWVMSGAVAAVRGEVAPGAWCRVLSSAGEVLGFGDYSPGSQIRVRLLSFGKDAPDPELVAARIADAVRRRAADPLVGETDALRLVNAEGDGLPGLLVDRYADVLVVRLASAGMAARGELVAASLRDATGAAAALARPDPTVARREALAQEPQLLWGAAPEGPVPVRERDRHFRVDVASGQKTGFYLDQRDARDLVARLARGRRVLDVFSYTGGFAVAAARGGASQVTLVDSSRPALDRAAEHLRTNAPDVPCALEKADAFAYLRGEPSGPGCDLLVIDPPPLARRRADLPRATRAYKDLLLHGLAHAAPGARVLFFACSHHVGPELFAKIVFGASLDARRPLRWLASLGAPTDHPVSVDHPEGRYLTGALLEIC